MSKELRHDRHTVSLLTDHMVFSPKYRGKVLVGEVAMLAKAMIRKTCKELDMVEPAGYCVRNSLN
jgi:putative transposase